MGQARSAFCGGDLLHRGDGIAHQLFQGDGAICNAVDKRGVGAVFQQAAHQVGKQRFVRAHRGINTAGPAQLACGHRAHDLLVQRLAHAVQALELVLPGVVVVPGHVVNGGQGLRVVCGELRVDGLGGGQQHAGAGKVRHIGVCLTRVDGVVVQAIDLGALDFAVPVSALDQPHHQAPLCTPGQVDHKIDHARAALLVGLDDETDAVPALQAGGMAQAFEQIERNVEPVGFFGIDVQADVVLACQLGQAQHLRVQLVHYALPLRAAVAWVQGRELDRDARPLINAPPVRRLADGVDRLLIRSVIAQRIFAGECGLAQHVVGIAEALALHLAGVGQRFTNGFARDELLAHHAHGHIDTLADQGFTALADQAPQRSREMAFAVRGDQLASQQQAPGGGVDEERGALAQVGLPLAAADLVADQRIARSLVGDAQQRFGQAHQSHALV